MLGMLEIGEMMKIMMFLCGKNLIIGQENVEEQMMCNFNKSVLKLSQIITIAVIHRDTVKQIALVTKGTIIKIKYCNNL